MPQQQIQFCNQIRLEHFQGIIIYQNVLDLGVGV